MDTPAIASLYRQHLDELQLRTAVALQRGGLDHLLIPSGTLLYQVFDDRITPMR
jgi:Xaa-Pro dipeptidase